MFLARDVNNDHADTLFPDVEKSEKSVEPQMRARSESIQRANLAKTHRSRLRRRERVGCVQKIGAESSYLWVEMRQICYNVSGLGVPLHALERRPPAAPADLLQRSCAAERVVCGPRVPQLVQHRTLNSEEIASFLDGTSYGLSGHAKNGGIGGSFLRKLQKHAAHPRPVHDHRLVRMRYRRFRTFPSSRNSEK